MDSQSINRHVAEQLGWHGPKLCSGCRITRDDALTNPNASCNHDKSHNPDFSSKAGVVTLLELVMKHFGDDEYQKSQFLYGLDVHGTKPFILRDFITLITTPGALLDAVYSYFKSNP